MTDEQVPNTDETAQGDTNAGQGGDGQTSSWFDSLPDDVKGNESYASLKDKALPDVLKEYTDAQGRLQNAIVPPGENATTEQKKEFETQVRKLLGVPEKVEDYKLTLPPEVPANDPVVASIVASGFANGLNQTQVQEVLNAGIKSITEFKEAQKFVAREEIQKLWGDQFQANVDLAIKGLEGTAKSAGLQAEEVAFLAKELPTSVMLVKVFKEVGKLFSEDKFVEGGAAGKSGEVERTSTGTPKLAYDKSPDMKW